MIKSIKAFIKILRNPPDPNWHIEREAKPSKKFPLGGFWKKSFSHDHGLAIGPAKEGKYFVTFCGPGGCFKKGSYRSNTTINDDPDYLVIDENTIEVKGKKGKMSRYVRAKGRENK